MNADRLLELLDLYVENRLSEIERAELSAELSRNPQSCRAFWRYVQQQALLSELVAESDGIRLAQSESAPPVAPSGYPWALAAGLLLAVGLGWILWPRPETTPSATLAELRGDVQLQMNGERVRAVPGLRLLPGTEVHTGEGSSVVVAYPDSSRLELTADTAVRLLEDVGVYLVRGEVNATVPPRPASRPLTLRTEQGDLLATGTRFRSANVEGETRVEVEEGRAVFGSRDGSGLEMLTGAYALLTTPEPEVYRAAPLLPLSGVAVRQIDEPSGPVMGLAVSPDGRRLAVPSWMGFVRVLNLANSEAESLFPTGQTRPNAVAFSPDGRRLAVGCEPNKKVFTPLTVWDVKTRQPLYTLRTVRRVNSLAFSPDSLSLAFVSPDRPLRGVNLWDLGDSRERVRLAERNDRMLCVAFHESGKFLASGCTDGTVTLGDPDTGRTIRVLEGHQRDVQALAFQPRGDLLASGGRDGAIHLWSMSNGELVRTLTGTFGEVRCLTFSPDGRTLASGHGGTAVLWDVTTGTKRTTFRAHRFAVTALAYLPDGRTLISAGWDRCVKLWELRTLEPQ